MHRPASILFLVLALLAVTSAAQQDMFKYMNRIPKCAITCILQEVPRSACKTVTNTTCLCSDEPLRQATQLCVRSTCESMLDALEAAKVEAEACERPYRDRRKALFASIPVQVLTFIIVCLRLVSRWNMSHSFEADDWIMLACLTFYILCLSLAKIAILVFFLRIFPGQTFRRITHLVIAVTALSTVVILLVQLCQCIPVNYNWEGWKGQFGSHRCIDLNALAFAAAGFSIVQDVVILILPLPPLLLLQVSWRTKAGIVFMFSLGIFILITSCIRLRFIVTFAKSFNPTWDYVEAVIWSGTEISVSMIVVMVPGLISTIASKTGWSFGNSDRAEKADRSHQCQSRVIALQPAHTGPESREGDPRDVEKEGSAIALRSPRRRSKVSRVSLYTFSSCNRISTNESEEALELGDRVRGEVHTEVRVDSGASSPRQHEPHGEEEVADGNGRTDRGIRVQTTTTVNSTYNTEPSGLRLGRLNFEKELDSP
ncbi:CFEM domain-containing protein [Plectosphaerella plurivora]|uniref:CFEM domain-containing protein n=1 Tax=Plectosphaerella plurivora TaxID=936078 RepID=A0A9P8VN22_9PEZI|nr:CFEM domain-containing protein [Plectosphaerella plurivora]